MPNKKTFQQLLGTLRANAGKCPKAPLNKHVLHTNGASVREAADALLGYHRYRRDAGRWKAINKGSSATFERAALEQAKEAARHGEDFSRSAMRVLQQATHTGWLGEMHGEFAAAMKGMGAIKASDLWRQATGDDAFRARLLQIGLSADVLAACDEHIAGLDASVVERNGSFVLHNGSQQELVIGGTPSCRPRNVLDLLQRGAAAKAMEHTILARPGVPPSIPVTPDRIPVDSFAAAGVVFAGSQIAAHYRRIQDLGVAAYAGEDPATIVLLIGLALVVAGLIGTVAFCDQDNSLYDADYCIASQFVMFFGLFLMGWSAFLGPSIISTGAYVFGWPVALATLLMFDKVMDIDITEEDI